MDRLLFFMKAQVRGGAMGDLFDERVHVDGFTRRDGAFVKPHETTVKKRHDEPSPGVKHFYVSAINGPKRHLVAGPYPSHEEALGMVQHVRAHADERDPRAHFMAWGTAGSAEEHKTPLGAGWKPHTVEREA